jgi:hypothetical protein
LVLWCLGCRTGFERRPAEMTPCTAHDYVLDGVAYCNILRTTYWLCSGRYGAVMLENRKIAVFFDVALRILTESCQCFCAIVLYPSDGGSRIIRTLLAFFTRLRGITANKTVNFSFTLWLQKPRETLKLLVTEERYWALFYIKKYNSVFRVHERAIPTEGPPLVNEVSANFCG